MELEPSLDMELIETQAEEHFEHDFSHTGTVELPNFASDYSEFVVGSVLERESETFNLFLTTFFVSGGKLQDGRGSQLKLNSNVGTLSRKQCAPLLALFRASALLATSSRNRNKWR